MKFKFKESAFPEGSVEDKILDNNPFSADYNLKDNKKDKKKNEKKSDFDIKKNKSEIENEIKDLINDTITGFDSKQFDIILKKQTDEFFSFMMKFNKTEFYKDNGFIMLLIYPKQNKIRFVNKAMDKDEFQDIIEDIQMSKDFSLDLGTIINKHFSTNEKTFTPDKNSEGKEKTGDDYISKKDFGLDDVDNTEVPEEVADDNLEKELEGKTKKEEVVYNDPEEKKKEEKAGKINEDKENFVSKPLKEKDKLLVNDFIKNNPNFKDEDLHEFAEQNNIGIHDAETYIYSLVSKSLKESKNTKLVVTIDKKDVEKFEKIINTDGYFFNKKKELNITDKVSYYFPESNPNDLEQYLTPVLKKQNINASFIIEEKLNYGEYKMSNFKVGDLVKINVQEAVKNTSDTYAHHIAKIAKKNRGMATIIDVTDGKIKIAESMRIGKIAGGVIINENAITKVEQETQKSYDSFNFSKDFNKINEMIDTSFDVKKIEENYDELPASLMDTNYYGFKK
jgi:hypothetical protein